MERLFYKASSVKATYLHTLQGYFTLWLYKKHTQGPFSPFPFP